MIKAVQRRVNRLLNIKATVGENLRDNVAKLDTNWLTSYRQ